MKKIVYGVYHDVNKEARSYEMLLACQKVGSVDFVSYAVPSGTDGIKSHIIDKSSPFALFSFIKEMKKVIKKVRPDIVVLHDNDCSILIPFVRKHVPNAKIFYDSSELYIPMPGKKKKLISDDGIAITIKQMLTSFRKSYEKKYLKNADVIFAANLERAEIMRDYFGLSELPLIFDNVHRIDDKYDAIECAKKFDSMFSENGFNILFAGGISEERKTFDYIDAVKKIGSDVNLVIVGTASPVAMERYKKAVLNADNIYYAGFITRAELRYLMTKSQASVVIFDKDSYNTLHCASGKCFESLFEGVPILASENPPLARLCNDYGIGVSSDNYGEAINKLRDNYEDYRANVNKYIKDIDYDNRLAELTKILEK